MYSDLVAIPKERFERKSAVNQDGSIRYWCELKYTLSFGMSDDYTSMAMECGGKFYGSIHAMHEWHLEE